MYIYTVHTNINIYSTYIIHIYPHIYKWMTLEPLCIANVTNICLFDITFQVHFYL